MEKQNRAEFEKQLGLQIAALLYLKTNRAGRVDTTWGTKTLQGLGATVLRIVDEHRERFAVPETETPLPPQEEASIHFSPVDNSHQNVEKKSGEELEL